MRKWIFFMFTVFIFTASGCDITANLVYENSSLPDQTIKAMLTFKPEVKKK